MALTVAEASRGSRFRVQVFMFSAYAVIMALWLYARLLVCTRRGHHKQASGAASDPAHKDAAAALLAHQPEAAGSPSQQALACVVVGNPDGQTSVYRGSSTASSGSDLEACAQPIGPPVCPGGGHCKSGSSKSGSSRSGLAEHGQTGLLDGGAVGSAFVRVTGSAFVRVVTLDADAVAAAEGSLSAAAEFGTLLLWFYIADRTRALGFSGKAYSRDTFLFVYLAVWGCAFLRGHQTSSSPVTLGRQQTEEWKGWMQVAFLMYHYFDAKEAYNGVRVLIAAYVWLTGYGNFHYYFTTGNFCARRFLQMLWRLNFLVAACCVLLRNSYMLYYICPMHTLFTVAVYAALGAGHRHNSRRGVIPAKLAACTLLVAIVWEQEAVFRAVWSFARPLLCYTDPRRPGVDDMHGASPSEPQ